MKKIIKLFIVILSLVVCVVPFVGCGNNDSPNLPPDIKNGEWFEVQNITYYTNGYNTELAREKTYTSIICYRLNEEAGEQSREIEVNRKEFIANLSKTTKDYRCHYVKIRFLSDNSIDINFDELNDHIAAVHRLAYDHRRNARSVLGVKGVFDFKHLVKNFAAAVGRPLFAG